MTSPEAIGAFDAQGAPVADYAAQAEAVKAAVVGQATACFELHNGASVVWEIQVTLNPNTYPFHVLGGTIRGTICGSPAWTVTSGSFGTTLALEAFRTGPGACASRVDIVGNFQTPSSYAGTYGFDGSRTSFPHTTLFKGWNPC
jgi:hypothetical protein